MNKTIYFVTATNTDVGKSYACEILLKKISNNGEKVGYYKPIETGVLDKPLDGTKLLNITKKLNPNYKVTIDDVVPYQFKLPAAPFVAKGETKIDIDFIKEKANHLLNKYCR